MRLSTKRLKTIAPRIAITIAGTGATCECDARYAAKKPAIVYALAQAKWNRPVTATTKPKLIPSKP